MWQRDAGMQRILVVDDSADTTELLRFILERRSYNTRVVETRDAQALAAVAEFSPHVIIADYIMPGMSLQEFFDAVRTINPQMQFVMISGRLDKASIFTKELGIPLLAKPFEPKALYGILEQITKS